MMKEFMQDAPFGNTLIVGAGPAGIHVAVDVAKGWCCQLGLLNRPGAHTDKIRQELEQTGGRIATEARVDKYEHLVGEAVLSRFYDGFDAIEDMWDTVFLCTPGDSYTEVVDAMRLDALQAVKRIVLLSPGIGSNLLVQSRLGDAKARVEVISFSTYYAATKFESAEAGFLTSSIKGIKRKIYVGSSRQDSRFLHDVQRFITSLGIQCAATGHPIEAESRSITTYVHPPFFLNPFSLQWIFSKTPARKYMYKLYPEGPITQDSIRAMLHLWKEVSEFVSAFGAQPINLLKFLNDDNYPVHEETLSRDDIENFMKLDPVKQEYLLYIRYASILIDPFSQPDERGRYFDFSAVPYKQVYKDKDGKWVIPRIPHEDYKRLKLLYALGMKMNVSMPQAGKLLELFESRLHAFIQEEGRDLFRIDLLADRIQEEAAIIYNELEIVR